MTATLVDTNVILDLLTADPQWGLWSAARLDAASMAGPLLINDVIYAELSVRFSDLERMNSVLANMRLNVARTPRAALFLAGRVFTDYRRSGGTRTGVLPDFFIGAHAAVSRLPILTRDTGRYRTYFPTVSLVTP